MANILQMKTRYTTAILISIILSSFTLLSGQPGHAIQVTVRGE